MEGFVDEKQSQKIVGSVFIGVAIMILAAILAIMFYWSYNKDKTLFISIFSVVMFLFSIMMLILVAVMRSKMNANVFKLYIGTTVFNSFMTIMIAIYFGIKASKRISEASSPSSYVPGSVQSYVGDHPPV